MKIILSRKGFDSKNGGIPSPLMPDGTLLSLPIPSSDEGQYRDLAWETIRYEELLKELHPGWQSVNCHIDPDLAPGRRIRQPENWQPAFGQMIPFTLKGVVLSISVIGLYAGKGLFISNRLVMLICSYCVVTMPYIYRGIRNSLYSIHVHQMVEAAELLGASRLYAFFRVVVPNMWTGVIVSFLLSFSCIFCDYAMISLILGSRFVTAQMKLYAMISSKGGPLTSAVVIIIFTTTFLISVLAYQFQKQTGEAAVKTTEE